MQGSREVIASTIFVPNGANPIVPGSAYMRNCNGGAIKEPVTDAAGHWHMFVPQDLAPLETSITARSQGPSPAFPTRNVTVIVTRNTPTPDTSRVDIYVRDVPGDALQGDSTDVEVTLARLPL